MEEIVDPHSAARVVDRHIDRTVTAKLTPVADMIVGMEFAIALIFDNLHRCGVMPRDEAIVSLRETRARNRQILPSEADRVLRHIQTMIEGLEEADPQKMRERFRLIRGDLYEKPPPNEDQPD